MSVADGAGRLIFAFNRLAIHVQLSALSVMKVDEALSEHLSLVEESL